MWYLKLVKIKICGTPFGTKVEMLLCLLWTFRNIMNGRDFIVNGRDGRLRFPRWFFFSPMAKVAGACILEKQIAVKF